MHRQRRVHSRSAEICWAAIWAQRRGLMRDAKRAGNARSAERALALRSTKLRYAHSQVKIDQIKDWHAGCKAWV